MRNDLRFQPNLRFICNQCGKCCDFITQSHRCLLSIADVAHWREKQFHLGLMLLFPVQTIDGYAAYAIPTKQEIVNGIFLEYVTKVDQSGAYCMHWKDIVNALNQFNITKQSNLTETGECLYLSTDNRCTIHDLRPGACRLFPYLQRGIVFYPSNELNPSDQSEVFPCPQDSFGTGDRAQEIDQHLLMEITSAEAAARAQEYFTIQQIETLLDAIWTQCFHSSLRGTRRALFTNF